MSSVLTTCSGCKTRLRVNADAGARMKCPRCGTVIGPEEPPPAAVKPRKTAEEPRHVTDTKPSARPAASKGRDREDDESRRPRRKRKDGPSTGLVLGLAGGGLLLLLIGGGVLAFVLMRHKSTPADEGGKDEHRAAAVSKKDSGKNTGQDARQEQKGETKQEQKGETKQEQKGDTKQERQPDTRQADEPPPPADGSLAPEVLRKIKAATV